MQTQMNQSGASYADGPDSKAATYYDRIFRMTDQLKT